MCSNHWPKLIDLTRDEAKRSLRKLELDAYAAVVSSFRAQGDLSKEKAKYLKDLQSILSISLERHKAEVRRAVNDEKLTTIADHMNGPNVSSEWLIEGRRLVPLMPRLVPQTAFTTTANNAANAQADVNQSLPPPSQTGKDIFAPPPAPPSNVPVPTPATKPVRPQSPPSNVVILPSGMSIHIKGLNSDDDETTSQQGASSAAKARPSDSYQQAAAVLVSNAAAAGISSSAALMTQEAIPAGALGVSAVASSQSQPLKINVQNSPAEPPQSHQVYYPKPLPSHIGAGHVSRAAVSMVTTTPFSSRSLPPGVMSSVGSGMVTADSSDEVSIVTAGSEMEVLKNIVTTFASEVSPPVMITHSQPPLHQHSISAQRISSTPHHHHQGTALGHQPALHYQPPVQQRAGRTVIPRPLPIGRSPRPAGPGRPPTMVAHSSGHHSGIGGTHIIKSTAGRPAIHIKQEGGMKIIAQGMPGSGTHKYISKHSAGGSGVVVMTTATTPVSRIASGGKILNISAGGGVTKVISTSRPSGGAGGLVTVNPKSFHIGSVRASTPTSVMSPVGIHKVVTTKSNILTQPGMPPGRVLATRPNILAQTGPSKSNVIVVQKKSGQQQGYQQVTPQRKVVTPVSHQSSTLQATPSPKTPPSGAIQSPFEKELVSFIQKQDSANRQVMSQHQRGVERRLAPKTDLQTPQQAKKITVVRHKADGTTTAQPVVIAQAPMHAGSKPSILAELIQSKPQDTDAMILEDQEAIASITGDTTTKEGVLSNQWIEVDAPINQTRAIAGDNADASAIKALLDLQQSSGPGSSGKGSAVRVRRESLTGSNQARSVYDIQAGVQVPQSDIITIDQSGNIVQQVIQEGESGVQYIQQTDQQTPMMINSKRDRQSTEIITDSGQAVQIEIANEEDLAQMGNVIRQEIIGELDPNTGILYTNTPFDGQQIIDTGSISSITPIHKVSLPSTSESQRCTPVMISTTPKAAAALKHRVMATSEGQADIGGSVINLVQDVDVSGQRGVDGRAVSHKELDGRENVGQGRVHRIALRQGEVEDTATGQGDVDGTAMEQGEAGGTATRQEVVEGSVGEVEGAAIGGGDIGVEQTETSSSHSGDFLSSALDHAHINLDPYQFMEEDGGSQAVAKQQAVIRAEAAEDESLQMATKVESSSLDTAAMVTGSLTAEETAEETNVNSSNSTENQEPDIQETGDTETMRRQAESGPVTATSAQSDRLEDSHVSQLTTEDKLAPEMSEVEGCSMESKIPPDVLLDVLSTASYRIPHSQAPEFTTSVISSTNVAPSITSSEHLQASELTTTIPQDIDVCDSEAPAVSVTNDPESQGTTVTLTVESGGHQSQVGVKAVAVDSTVFDSANLQLSEFTSQKVAAERESAAATVAAGYSSLSARGAEFAAVEEQLQAEGLSSPGSSYDSLADSLNKRKRKAPPKADEIITQNQVGGWIRLALGLLQRVSRYRGLYKQKGDLNAASWFTHPVNRAEVPDYYNIIQYPMDFNTIKKKLETSQYRDWNEFHGDMMLIRDNCYQYNPEGSEVRLDCDEVFAFYIPEYDKCLQKWQQSQTVMPSHKKPRLDRSPTR